MRNKINFNLHQIPFKHRPQLLHQFRNLQPEERLEPDVVLQDEGSLVAVSDNLRKGK